MRTIGWGIIGCGDVTEMKSGPGFQKAANSRLVAVMRRRGELARDYARRVLGLSPEPALRAAAERLAAESAPGAGRAP